MALPSEPTVLPFKSEAVRCGGARRKSSAATAEVACAPATSTSSADPLLILLLPAASFSLNYKINAAPTAQVELACVCFGALPLGVCWSGRWSSHRRQHTLQRCTCHGWHRHSQHAFLPSAHTRVLAHTPHPNTPHARRPRRAGAGLRRFQPACGGQLGAQALGLLLPAAQGCGARQC